MRRCLTCEGLLPDSDFLRDSPICKTCVEKLRDSYKVEYAPPERTTSKEAAVQMIVAVMEQAQHDEESGTWSAVDREYGGPVAAWRAYWVDDPSWNRIWSLLLDIVSNDATIRSAFSMGKRR